MKVAVPSSQITAMTVAVPITLITSMMTMITTRPPSDFDHYQEDTELEKNRSGHGYGPEGPEYDGYESEGLKYGRYELEGFEHLGY